MKVYQILAFSLDDGTQTKGVLVVVSCGLVVNHSHVATTPTSDFLCGHRRIQCLERRKET
jgi:hypothetical protein